MHRKLGMISAAAILAALGLAAASRAEAPAQAPRFTADGKMEFPRDYRTWVYLSTGMDMSYVEGSQNPDTHILDNVFVNRGAYDGFLKTGHWPDKTVFVLEARRAAQTGSINKRGHFQTGVLATEVHVKDAARFKDTGGWQFFGFRDPAQPAAAIPVKAGCISCHEEHAAVDTTFVQFYPTLLPVARAKKTLGAGYLNEEAAGGAR